MSRDNLEAVAIESLRTYNAAITDQLPNLFKNDESYEDLRKAFIDLSKTFVEKQLSVKQSDNKWTIETDKVSTLDDNTLEDISRKSQAVLREASKDQIVLNLETGSREDFLNAIRQLATVQEAAGINIPNLTTLDSVLSTPEVEELPEMIVMIPDERLHYVAGSSLDILENIETSKPQFNQETEEAIDALRDSLIEANYLVPGENTSRTLPYRDQAPRGSREELEDILEKAKVVYGKLSEVNINEINFSNDVNTSMAIAALSSKANNLDRNLKNAVPVEIEVAKDPDAIDFSNSPLKPQGAEAIINLFAAAEDIANKAQLDTEDHEYVMFPKELVEPLKANLEEVIKTSAYSVIVDAAEGNLQLPGVSIDSAYELQQSIDTLKDFSVLIQKRDGTDRVVRKYEGLDEGAMSAVPQETMDKYNNLASGLVDLGVMNSIATMTGKEEMTTLSLNNGRDSSGFATLQEAMTSGRTPGPEAAFRGYGKVLTEMSLAAYDNLSKKPSNSNRIFMLRPGKGPFKGYKSYPINDAAARERQAKRLRTYIRDNLVNKDGGINYSFRQNLMSLRTKNIVAPSKQEALVLREESERLYELLRQKNDARMAKYIEEADTKNLDFQSSEMKRFLSVLEASGSKEPATLIKNENTISLEHPEAPRLVVEVEDMGILANARDGYKLNKVKAEDLRSAYEMGQPSVRLQLANDRTVSIRGVDPQKVDQNTKVREEDPLALS